MGCEVPVPGCDNPRTCPGRRCVSWDDNAVSVAMLLFCNVAFTVMLATIVIGGFVTLLRGGKMD